MGKLTTKYNGDLRMVVYIDGKPDSAFTTMGIYDFDDSRRWGLLYHQSGAGRCYLLPFDAGSDKEPLADVWIADGVEVNDGSALDRKALSPEDIRTMGYRLLPTPRGDPFDGARECECGIVQCMVCEDCMPDQNECFCNHLFDCHLGTRGPGCDEDYQAFALPVIELACRSGIARAWRRSLAAGEDAEVRISAAVGGLGREFVSARMGYREVGTLVKYAAEAMAARDWDIARLAACWFISLDANTKDANQATLEWLDLVIACQDERRASGARVYALRVGGRDWDRGKRTRARYTWPEALAAARERRAKGQDVRIVYVRPRAMEAQ